jgi:hypothetical protein
MFQPTTQVFQREKKIYDLDRTNTVMAGKTYSKKIHQYELALKFKFRKFGSIRGKN